MRLDFACKMTQLKELVGEAIARDYKDVTLVMTDAELSAVLRHPEASKMFPEYFDDLAQKTGLIDFEILELKESVMRINDVQEKERLYSLISDKEAELQNLTNHRKSNFTLKVKGIPVRIAQIS